jgi:hypothetical protein
MLTKANACGESGTSFRAAPLFAYFAFTLVELIGVEWPPKG